MSALGEPLRDTPKAFRSAEGASVHSATSGMPAVSFLHLA